VIIAVIVAILAAIVGLLRGGSLRALSEVRVQALWVLYAGLVLQVGFDIWNPDWLGPSGGLAVLLATNLLIAIFFWLNREQPGSLLAATGFLMNVVVIAFNGAMPVSHWAADLAGLGGNFPVGLKHEWLTDQTLLPWIADVIPIPGNTVVSAGDVVLAAGIAWFVFSSTTRETSEAEARSGTASG
jgi:Family of unknown function (DUF5317)